MPHSMYATLNVCHTQSRRNVEFWITKTVKQDSLKHLQYSIIASQSLDRVVINNCVAAFHALVLVECPFLGAKKYDKFCGSPSNLTQIS